MSVSTIDGGEASRVVFVPPEQNAVVTELSDRLTQVLSEMGALSTSASLAAVAMAVERLIEGDEPEGESSGTDEGTEDQDG